jgi:hypothetical protein
LGVVCSGRFGEEHFFFASAGIGTRIVHAVAQLIEALHNKPDGRGFYSLWFLWNFLSTFFFRPQIKEMSMGEWG